MQNLRICNVKILAFAIILLLISCNVTALKICEYGSEEHGCDYSPLTWPRCWGRILIDIGNCVMMFFISKMTEYILMSPDITVFKPFVNDIVSLLFPIYVIAIITTGIYIIFLSTNPESRARAKLILIRLILGMAMVTISLSIYELLLNIAQAIAGKILAGWVVAGGVGGLTIMTILITVSVVFFYISAWLLPALALIALISIVSRYFLVCLMAVLFPLALFFYFFEFTKGIGSNMMKYTMMAIFTQPVQALMLVIMIIGLQNVGTGEGGEKVIALFIGLAGLIMIIAAPLMMLGLMKWIGGAVAGAGMIVAFKRPLLGAALVSAGGVGTGMGPEAFVAGGSAYVLGQAYARKLPPPERKKKHYARRVARWVGRRKTVQTASWRIKKSRVWKTRAGKKITSGYKWLGDKKDVAGRRIGDFKKIVKDIKRYKWEIGKSLFIPGYWAFAIARGAGRRVGLSVVEGRYTRISAAVQRSATQVGIIEEVRKVGGDEAVKDLNSSFAVTDREAGELTQDIADSLEDTWRRIGRTPAARDYYENIAEGILKNYKGSDYDVGVIASKLKQRGVDEGTISRICNKYVSLDKYKDAASKIIKRDKAIKYDFKRASNFEEIEKINKDLGEFGLSEKELGRWETAEHKRNDIKSFYDVMKGRDPREEGLEDIMKKKVMEDIEVKKFEELKKKYKTASREEINRKLRAEMEELRKKPEELNSMIEKGMEARHEEMVEDLQKKIRGTGEYREVAKKVRREIKRKGRWRYLPEELDNAVDIEMKKKLSEEIKNMQKMDKLGEKPRYYGEISKLMDEDITRRMPITDKGKTNLVNSLKADRALKRIDRARTFEDVRVAFREAGVLDAEVEEATMKMMKVSREDAIKQNRLYLATLKRSATKAVQYRKERLEKQPGAFGKLKRGVELAGLSLVPFIGPVVLAKRIRPSVEGVKRAGWGVRGRLEKSIRGRWIVEKWDSSKRRAGSKFEGAGKKISKAGEEALRKSELKGLRKELAEFIEVKDRTSLADADRKAQSLVNDYDASNDFDLYISKALKTRGADDATIDIIRRKYGPERLGRPVLEKAGISKAGQSLKGVGDKIEKKLKIRDKVKYVWDHDEKIAWETGKSLLSPFYGPYLLIGALRGRGLPIVDPLLLGAYWTAMKAGTRIKKSRAGRVIGEKAFKTKEKFYETKTRAGEAKEEALRRRDLNKLRKDLAEEFRRLRLSGADADKVAKAVVGGYARDGRYDFDMHVGKALKTRGADDATIDSLRRKYGPERLGRPVLERAGEGFEPVKRTIGKGVEELKAGTGEGEERIVKAKEEALRRRDLNKLRKDLAEEFRRLRLSGADADKVAKAVVGGYAGDGRYDFDMHVGKALKTRGADDATIDSLRRKYGPERLGRPVLERAGEGFEPVKKTVGTSIGTLKEKGLSVAGAVKESRVWRHKKAIIVTPYGGYLIGRSVYRGISTGLANKNLQRIKNISYREFNTAEGPKKLRDTLKKAGISEGEARLLLSDEPVKSEKDFEKLQKQAIQVVLARRLMGRGQRKFTAEFFKPFKPSKTIKKALVRGRRYGAYKHDLKRVEEYYKKEISLGKDPEMVMENVNKMVNNAFIESRGFLKHLRLTGRKYGVRDSEVKRIGDHMMESRDKRVLDFQRGKKISASKKVKELRKKLADEFYNKTDDYHKRLDPEGARRNAEDAADRAVNNYVRDYDFTELERRLHNRGVDKKTISEFRRDYGTEKGRSTLNPGLSHLDLNEVNAQVLVDGHRSANEAVTVKGYHKMRPEMRADYVKLGMSDEKELQQQLLNSYLGVGPKPSDFLTKEEAGKILFTADLGSNLHARMLLEDYMGIGPRPSEFYHGIGPETKEEREEEREREEESPLYASATTKTETVGEIILGGLREPKKSREEKKE